MSATSEPVDTHGDRYGNAFLLSDAPDNRLPDVGMPGVDAMRLLGEELVLDGIPWRNLATFVTTWMEPEAQRIIAENLHRNYIDHAEYPQTAVIEQRCIRMLADLYHAPGETTGTRTQGSSEAIMLGALSLKWKWRARREAAGKPTDRPNLVFGGDVHVVWEKFCRYFDVEPRIIPLQPHKFTIGPEDVEPHLDENTIGVAAVLGTTFTGHADDIVGINDLLVRLHDEQGLDVPLHIDGASGGFVWPFLYPDSPWDFRLERVRSINVSGHKYGLVYPGLGWLVFREPSDLAEDLVFYENYLGKRDATFTLNFSTGAAMVLAQYYNFIRYGREGYTVIMETMQANARALAEKVVESADFELVGDPGAEQLPLVAFKLAEKRNFDEFDVAGQLAAERGWMIPAYTLPPNAQHVTIMRALVKQTLGHARVSTLAQDITEAVGILDAKGGLHERERERVKTGTATDPDGVADALGVAVKSRLRELVKAIRDGDETMVEAAVLRMSRSRRWLAPLAFAVGALEMLFQGVKLVFTNWRLTVVQILPAMWIWLAMLDLKAHVLHGRSFHVLRGPIVIPLVVLIAAITAAAFFLNAVFAFAIARPGPPEVRAGFAGARRHLRVVLGSGAAVGLLLGLATIVVTRWGRPWFSLSLGVVIGLLMVCYVAVPSSLIGINKPTISRRDKLTASAVGGALGATVSTPPYLLGRIGILMLGSHALFIPGIVVVAVGFALQAGATGAVKAVKLSAHLVAGGASTADASRRLPGEAEQPP